MNISRSGYYKWLKTKDILNQYEINRRDLESLIRCKSQYKNVEKVENKNVVFL